MSKVKWAFIHHTPGVVPGERTTVIEGDGLTSVLVAVDDNADALKVAAKLVDDGIDFIELCGSFANTPGFVDQVIKATDNRVPVGAVTFTKKAADDIAAIFERSTEKD